MTRKRTIRRVVATTALCLSTPVTALEAQWDGFRLFFENDSMILPVALRTDRNYTNGMRLELRQDRHHRWSIADDFWRICPTLFCPAKVGGKPDDAVSAVVVAQTMFSPEDITAFTPNPLDRPFAGHLHAGAFVTVTRAYPGRFLTWPAEIAPETVLELDFGVLGPLSLAGVFQAGAHTGGMGDLPKGWRAQLGTEPTLQLSYRVRSAFRTRPGGGPIAVEVTPEASFAVGTVTTRAGVGAFGRIGLHVSGLPSGPIGPYAVAAAPRRWGFALVGGARWNRVWYDAMLDGAALTGGPSVSRVPSVGEWLAGFELRADPLSIALLRVSRARETTPLPPPLDYDRHVVESLSLTYQPGSNGALGDLLTTVLERLKVEIGYGTGSAGDGAAVKSGRASRFALGIASDRVGLTVEQNASAFEARAPALNGQYTDEFFRSRAVSVWAAPRMTRFGRPVLRVGFGRARHRSETLVAASVITSSERDGLRPLVGVGYEVFIPGSRQVALGVDFAWNPVPLLAASHGRMVVGVIGLHWRPRLP